MRHSRPEVARWRMLRQATRRRRRWLESQSRRNIRHFALRKPGNAPQRPLPKKRPSAR